MTHTPNHSLDSLDERKWDDLDHLLGICDCLPPHDYLYNSKDQKQAISDYVEAEKQKAYKKGFDEAWRKYDPDTYYPAKQLEATLRQEEIK